MEITWDVILIGFKKGLFTTFELAKVIVPTAMIVSVIRATGGLQLVSDVCAPFMGILGLPGEAAVVLLSGYLLSLYAAIGAMVALDLSLAQMTIIGVMLGFCHSLVVELAISRKAGAPVTFILPLRLGTSILAGIVLGGVL